MKYDVIIIGGGFYGLSIAAYLSDFIGLKNILVLEKENDFMLRASYNNQARIHNGYHYPRSLLTGLRSRVNFPIFVKEYSEAVVDSFDKYYAIARMGSMVNARQFYLFSKRIGSEIEKAPSDISKRFNKNLIEDVFRVKEYAFDSSIVKEKLLNNISNKYIKLLTGSYVRSIKQLNNMDIEVSLNNGGTYISKRVINCSYSSINEVNYNSNLPIIALKHEMVEMCLVELPEEIKNISVTVMDGPFFSFMPFPDRKLNTLSHVRYTPHSEWQDNLASNSYKNYPRKKLKSNYEKMFRDVCRYIPDFKRTEYKDSLWEVKTVLAKSEVDDSRPILFRDNHGIKNYSVVMGGKIDNIYDIYRELDLVYGQA